MNIIDLSDGITLNVLKETVDSGTLKNMKQKCDIKPYRLT